MLAILIYLMRANKLPKIFVKSLTNCKDCGCSASLTIQRVLDPLGLYPGAPGGGAGGALAFPLEVTTSSIYYV